MSTKRKSIIQRFRNIGEVQILEIGALDNPTYRKSEANVAYLDFADKESLHKSHPNNPRYSLERLVDVDYVCKTINYSDVIDKRFDLIIANHVIEHVPDTITWLNEMEKLLLPNGKVFLSVPDKRYTFDIVRRCTVLSDLLFNFEHKKKKPSFYDIFDHLYYHKAIKAKDVWDGNYKSIIEKNRFSSVQQAYTEAEKLSTLEYADVHVHVYTKDSFVELITLLRDLNLINFTLDFVDEVEPQYNEFHVILGKVSQ